MSLSPALTHRRMSFLDEDDLSYDSYAETTINPGNTLFTIALVISVCSLVSVPIIVQLGKCISNSRQLQKCENTGNSQHTNIVEKVSNDQDGTETVAETLDGSVEQSAIQPKQQQNESFLYETLSIIWTIVKVDHETKRILSLAIPFTCSAIAKTSSELVILAIISHTLGNDAMVAYAMTYGLVGITFSFMGGWHDAITSLVSMAYGAENYDLAGAYVQTACLSYILCEIPWGIMWYFSMKQILSFMGFDVSVANLGQDFVLMRVLINVMTGINQSILNFLFAIEHEKFANVMFSIGAIANAVFVAIAAYHFDVNLVILGLVLLMNASLIFFLIVAIPLVLRWVKQFENGLFGSCTWTDMTIMTDVFKVALPIAFGSLCAYAEWEMLTFFAATLGPAEAAAWAVMGFVWDVFESTTEAIGESSELRVAYHLGKGRPAMAKLAAYKSIILGAVVSIFMAIIFISLIDILPALMTRDITMQAMLEEIFPLVALGNVTMSMGMICWHVVGAQGRYHLSTTVAIVISFAVTIPLGAIMTIGLIINLQGLAFSAVTGYTVIAMILFALILMSDWEKLSEKIQKQVGSGDISLSDLAMRALVQAQGVTMIGN